MTINTLNEKPDLQITLRDIEGTRRIGEPKKKIEGNPALLL